MARRLFTLTSAARLLLFVGVCVLRALSYLRPGHWIVARMPTHSIRPLSNNGAFALQRTDPPPATGRTVAYPSMLNVPYPVIVVGLLVVPAAGILARRRAASNRRRAGLCAACGYDLRASAGRCPECGAVPKWNPISN